MTNDLKWMLSSDQQFPYQDDKMIALWFKVMKWFKPDVVDNIFYSTKVPVSKEVRVLDLSKPWEFLEYRILKDPI